MTSSRAADPEKKRSPFFEGGTLFIKLCLLFVMFYDSPNVIESGNCPSGFLFT